MCESICRMFPMSKPHCQPFTHDRRKTNPVQTDGRASQILPPDRDLSWTQHLYTTGRTPTWHTNPHIFQSINQSANQSDSQSNNRISVFCSVTLLLARLMDQYCFARWRLSPSSVVVCNAASGRVGWPRERTAAARPGAWH